MSQGILLWRHQSVRVCVCVYICARACVCGWVGVDVKISTYVSACVFYGELQYVNTDGRTHTIQPHTYPKYKRTQTRTNTHTHIRTHAYMHTCTHTHTYTHTHAYIHRSTVPSQRTAAFNMLACVLQRAREGAYDMQAAYTAHTAQYAGNDSTEKTSSPSSSSPSSSPSPMHTETSSSSSMHAETPVVAMSYHTSSMLLQHLFTLGLPTIVRLGLDERNLSVLTATVRCLHALGMLSCVHVCVYVCVSVCVRVDVCVVVCVNVHAHNISI